MNIQLNRKNFYFGLMIMFFLLALVYIPFENSTKYTILLIDKRLPLFGFAMVGMLGVNNKFKLSCILNTFIVFSVVAIFYIVFYRIGIRQFIIDPCRADLFANVRKELVNSHMGFNFYLNVSIISIWFILRQTWNWMKWWIKSCYILALLLILYALFISEGRSGFVIGLLLVLSFLLIEVWKRKKIMGVIVALIIPFVMLALASEHKRMDNEMLKNEPRWFLWHSAINVIKESSFIGNGISDAQEKFDISRTKFQTEAYEKEWEKSFHLDCHNQYLQTTMEFGIIGLILLVFLYVYPIFLIDRQRKLLAVSILLLCAYQSVFDMFLTGPFSTMFGILIVLTLSAENNIVLKQETLITE